MAQEYVIKDGPCGTEAVFKIIGARWKPKILETCYLQNGASLAQLKEKIPDCAGPVLSRTLSSLVNDEILLCGVDGVYSLTERAREVLPIMTQMQHLTYYCDYPGSGYESTVEYAKKLIGEKWKSRILWVIHSYGTIRLNELQKSIEGISHKVLGEQLEDMRLTGLVEKTEYQEQPPRTEYTLTKIGGAAYGITQALAEWGKKYGYIKARVVIYTE